MEEHQNQPMLDTYEHAHMAKKEEASIKLKIDKDTLFTVLLVLMLVLSVVQTAAMVYLVLKK